MWQECCVSAQRWRIELYKSNQQQGKARAFCEICDTSNRVLFSACCILLWSATAAVQYIYTYTIYIYICTYIFWPLHCYDWDEVFIFVFFKHVDIYTYTRLTHKYKVNMYRLYNGVKKQQQQTHTQIVRTRICKQSYKHLLTTTTTKWKKNQAQQHL